MKILFIPSTNPSVKTMAALAGWLSARGYEVKMVVNPQQKSYLMNIADAEGFQLIDFKSLQTISLPVRRKNLRNDNGANDEVISANDLSWFRRKLASLHHNSSSVAIIILGIYWILQILRFRILWKKVIARMGVDRVFIWGDNAGTTNGELLNLLKANGAKLIHLPVSLTDQDVIARLRWDFKIQQVDSGSTWIAKFLAKFYPDQFYSYKGRRVYYYHPSEILAMSLLGNVPSKPWILGGSKADQVWLSSSSEYDYWVQRGLNSSKVSVIGSLDLQGCGEAVKKIRQNHGGLFEGDRPLVLINMPNLIEHGVLSDWGRLWFEVSLMLKPFTNKEINVVVSLHPKSDYHKYEHLEKLYSCSVVQGDIGAWISISDLYMSACSTTELIAAEFDVPVLDIGRIYGFETEILNGLKNVQFYHTYDEYIEGAALHLANMRAPSRRFRYDESQAANNSAYLKIDALLKSTVQ